MIKKFKTVLSISHYIYLSKEQRYAVFDGKTVEAIGVSVPVWFKAGATSEPAKEVFCKYIITNEEDVEGVVSFNEGYKINFGTFDKEVCLRNIIDIKDRGHEELVVKGYSKVAQGSLIIKAFHCIEVKPIELLLLTLS